MGDRGPFDWQGEYGTKDTPKSGQVRLLWVKQGESLVKGTAPTVGLREKHCLNAQVVKNPFIDRVHSWNNDPCGRCHLSRWPNECGLAEILSFSLTRVLLYWCLTPPHRALIHLPNISKSPPKTKGLEAFSRQATSASLTMLPLQATCNSFRNRTLALCDLIFLKSGHPKSFLMFLSLLSIY